MLGASPEPSAGFRGGRERAKLARGSTRDAFAPRLDASPAAKYRVLVLLLPPEALARAPLPEAPAVAPPVPEEAPAGPPGR
ncbi:MAG: hypothetical protein BWX69_00440 [Planctomycetes bacterium ADurb.Bin069]|nr:MAG: hypothetical protein BWX69_00440 [Planctomycetes bacterium ADurb.Bin069]HNR98253.1 hypothetical protein [Planctomycetota bacterium]